MNWLGRLYFYEIKKIMCRKMVWIVGIIMVLLCVFVSISDLISTSYGEGNNDYERTEITKQYARNLSGRNIDDDLLQEMQDSYREEMKDEKVREYLPIYLFVQDITGNDDLSQELDADELYLERQKSIDQNRADQMLTEKEIEFWKEKELQIEIPITYEYTDGWSNLWVYVSTINFMLLLMLVICLSNVFSMEHSRKTDAIILCSQYGRKQLYIAKILAGVTFALVASIVLFGTTAISSLVVYGIDGFNAALQSAFPMSSWTTSIGESILILFFTLLVVSVLNSIVIMFLSELLKNSVVVMAIPVGIMLLTMMIDIPYQFRIFSQIYDLLPTNLLMVWELWDDRLVPLFGEYLTNFQIAPIIYFVIAILLFIAGKRIYQKYQIGAR